jgi:hypothetical protein
MCQKRGILVSFETIPCCLSREEHIAQQILPQLSDFRVIILRGNRDRDICGDLNELTEKNIWAHCDDGSLMPLSSYE